MSHFSFMYGIEHWYKFNALPVSFDFWRFLKFCQEDMKHRWISNALLFQFWIHLSRKKWHCNLMFFFPHKICNSLVETRICYFSCHARIGMVTLLWYKQCLLNTLSYQDKGFYSRPLFLPLQILLPTTFLATSDSIPDHISCHLRSVVPTC